MKEMSKEEIKSTSIEVLDFIDKVCKEYNLKYFLGFGTLLGAVRHKGFIPWDDDIDIMMPREDYEMLFKVWPQNITYAAKYYKNTRNWPYAYGKVIDTRTLKKENFLDKYNIGGIDVDIFPIDSLPKDEKEIESFYMIIDKMQNKLYNHVIPYRKGRTVFRSFIRAFVFGVRRIVDWMGVFTVERIVKRIDVLSQKYNGIGEGYCGVTCVSYYGKRMMNPLNNFKGIINVIFEGKEYPTLSGYTDYLTRLYGSDYMMMPPGEKRKTHHSFKIYWK